MSNRPRQTISHKAPLACCQSHASHSLFDSARRLAPLLASNQAPDESYLFNRDYASAILPSAVHDNRSVEEILLERKCFFSLPAATPVPLPLRGCPPLRATAPGEPAMSESLLCRLATTRIAPLIIASAPSKTPARRMPRL